VSAVTRRRPGFGAPVHFTDGVLADIRDVIASVPPERGAALLGVGDVVTLAVHDSFGSYSSVYWDISAELNGVVQSLEQAGAGRLKGTVHSHPRGVTGPSGTDIASTATTLRLNPHIPSLVVAIVTEGAPFEEHHLPIGRTHRMSLQRVRLVDDRPVVEPIQGSTFEIVAGARDGGVEVTSGVLAEEWTASARGAAGLAETLALCGRFRGGDAIFLNVPGAENRALVVPTGFPTAGPLLVEVEEGRQLLLPSPWDPAEPPRRQLRVMLDLAARTHTAGSLDRATPVVGDLSRSHVVVAGLGSVGSRIAEDLVRAGVGSLTLIDPDLVEAPNLARSVYTVRDLGEQKTRALERRLREIAPAVRLQLDARPLGEIDLRALLDGVDLVIGATDDMREQLLLAHHAYAREVPVVCCAMYALAKAGEIVVALPAMGSPCVACSLGDGRNINQFRPEKDYGLKGRLVAEPGLGASIQLVASMASLTALALLAGPESTLAPVVAESVGTGRTLAMISTQPRWAFFPEIVGGPTQVAPQSVWVRVQRAADCVVCGAVDTRVPPPDGEFIAGLAEVLAAHRAEEVVDGIAEVVEGADAADGNGAPAKPRPVIEPASAGPTSDGPAPAGRLAAEPSVGRRWRSARWMASSRWRRRRTIFSREVVNREPVSREAGRRATAEATRSLDES
jgi:molybdopterin/thiamine biosynthesis adenylyltransferase